MRNPRAALHLDLFEQPGEERVFQQPGKGKRDRLIGRDSCAFGAGRAVVREPARAPVEVG